MPFYQNLDASSKDDSRTIQKLLNLRKALKDQIPKRTQSETLLLATWNIRDFDKKAWGYRLAESYYYMAEIIASYDIVAIQEVYRNLYALDRLMSILGGHWKYVFSDTTEGTRGNDERIAYVYDSRKIKFGGLAGELVIPPIEKRVEEDGKKKTIYQPVGQVWRTPLICGFQAGWAKFMLCSVHIQWGANSAEPEGRVNEIKQVAEFLKNRTEDDTAWARKIILLGDFNIFSTNDKTYKVLEDNGFKCPDPIFNEITNVAKDKKPYDQILIRERVNRFEILSGGAFNFFEHVFKDDEEDIYRPMMTKVKAKPEDKDEFYSSYKKWKTYQMSDHLPLWVELKIDYADEYLQDKLSKKADSDTSASLQGQTNN